MKFKENLLILILAMLSTSAFALLPMTNDEIRKMIVEGELNQYERGQCPSEFLYQNNSSQTDSQAQTINPAQCVCPCPYSKDLQGKSCGSNSAYVRYEGENICYPEDIPDWVLDEYRVQHDIPRK